MIISCIVGVDSTPTPERRRKKEKRRKDRRGRRKERRRKDRRKKKNHQMGSTVRMRSREFKRIADELETLTLYAKYLANSVCITAPFPSLLFFICPSTFAVCIHYPGCAGGPLFVQ